MKSSNVKRSIVIDGHSTSVSLEDAFWNGLKKIAHARRMSLPKMVTEINEAAPTCQPVLSDPSVRRRPSPQPWEKTESQEITSVKVEHHCRGLDLSLAVLSRESSTPSWEQ
jgi:hypothetical protein